MIDIKQYKDWEAFVLAYFSDNTKYYIKTSETNEWYSFLIHSPHQKETVIVIKIDKQEKKRLLLVHFNTFIQGVENLGYFNCIYPYGIQFLPNSFVAMPQGKEYELEYTDKNVQKLLKTLEVPLFIGWEEEQYYFKGNLYKTEVNVKIDNKNLSFKLGVSGIEEDIPLFFDNIFLLINKFIIAINFLINKKKFTTKKFIINPILKNS